MTIIHHDLAMSPCYFCNYCAARRFKTMLTFSRFIFNVLFDAERKHFFGKKVFSLLKLFCISYFSPEIYDPCLSQQWTRKFGSLCCINNCWWCLVSDSSSYLKGKAKHRGNICASHPAVTGSNISTQEINQMSF